MELGKDLEGGGRVRKGRGGGESRNEVAYRLLVVGPGEVCEH